MRKGLQNLLQQLCRDQSRLLKSRFVAPCVPPADIRTRFEGLLYLFQCDTNFEGWGIFQPLDEKRVKWIGQADPAGVESYLNGLKSCCLRLIRPLKGLCWLAYPMYREIGDRIVIVHLVEGGGPWAAVQARFDGRNLWWESQATADPRVGEALLQAAVNDVEPGDLDIPGLTPGDRSAYSVEFLRRHPRSKPQMRPREVPVTDGERLERALRRGGGRLRGYTDQGQSWVVQWLDSGGQIQTSTIGKSDLGVVSAGICLSGQDAKFDLTSLVGVVEGFE